MAYVYVPCEGTGLSRARIVHAIAGDHEGRSYRLLRAKFAMNSGSIPMPEVSLKWVWSRWCRANAV